MPTFDQLELFDFDPRREQARALRRAGAAVSDIQEHLAIESYYRALSLVADIAAPNQKLRARAKDEVKARARELRERGKTYTEIAKVLGVSKS
jgi:transcriptional regulator